MLTRQHLSASLSDIYALTSDNPLWRKRNLGLEGVAAHSKHIGICLCCARGLD
jgi:hypothetical protein